MGLLDQAIQNHTLWKIKLLSAMSGGSKIDTHLCGSELHCDLGRWLQSDLGNPSNPPIEPKHAKKPEQLVQLEQLRQAHSLFHQEAGAVALQVERHEIETARVSIFQGAFHHSMVNFIQAVDAIKGMQLKGKEKGREKDKEKSNSPTHSPQDWESKQARQKERLAAAQSSRTESRQ